MFSTIYLHFTDSFGSTASAKRLKAGRRRIRMQMEAPEKRTKKKAKITFNRCMIDAKPIL